MDRDRISIETFAALIARSPIVMARLAARFPAGFDEVDAAILDWIAAEGRAHRPRLCFDVSSAPPF